MDTEQEEMQFLGLFGVYVEAYKVIFRWRKIFSQITLALILPLSFIFLAHMEVSHYLNSKIRHKESQLHNTHSGTERKKKLGDLVSSEWATLCVLNIFYYSFLLILSLLSTSAVVYTIACIYTGREITFKKVMSVVPKVWKRLVVTFLCTYIAFFVYNIVAVLVLVLWAMTVWEMDVVVAGGIVLIILLILYVAGFVYMTVLWQLASVVSVLEDSYGIRAMMKSKELIKGKMLITVVIFFKLIFSLAVIQMLFDEYVVHGWRIGLFLRMGLGILCLLLLFKLLLFGLVIQTIIYFVCKSYHHENIDKSSLSDQLEVYLGDYVPLKLKDIQLEHFGEYV